MQFSIFKNQLSSWQGRSLIIGLNKDYIDNQLETINFIVDLKQLIKKLNDNNFKGEIGNSISLEILGHNLDSLTIIGLGEKNEMNTNVLRNSLSECIRKVIDKEEKIGMLMPWDALGNNAIYDIAETLRLSTYKDNRFNKHRDEKITLKEIEFLNLENIESISFKEVENICQGVEFARKLVAAPPNDLTPLAMSKKAIEIANEHNLEIKILEENDCKNLGMGAYLAVAKGSNLKPKFIHITYRPENSVSYKVALVGKGLTFDSGGYNLKVGASQIEMMKYDMGGSAAVLGAAKAIGALKPKGVEIHFIVAACET